ncbi:MAG: endonuclease domain-containing protein, partial [Thermoanaerobaculia bacterium]
KLWRRLRNRGLAGAKFRRQCPVGSYVVDFYCDEARLVVELDGGGHAQEEQRPRDLRRTGDIEALGVRVLRFWNGDVLNNVEGVLQRISAALEHPSP